MAETLQLPEIEIKPGITADDLYSKIKGSGESKVSIPVTSENLFEKLSKAEAEDKLGWGEVAAQSAQNLIPSAVEFGKNLYGAVRHPVETASSVLDLARGGLHNIMPEDIAKWVDAHDTDPEHLQKGIEMANAVGKFYKERYGSGEGFKKALAQDPVGVASDLSAVLSGGASIAGKVGAPAKVISTLEKAADVTNPITGTAKAIAGIGKPILGLTTGTGAENIAQAAKSGWTNDPDFWRHLTGQGSITEPLENARYNLSQMKINRSNEYRSGMTDISKDKSILDFNDIDKAVSDAKDSISFKGKIKDDTAFKIHQELEDEISKWKKSDAATYHTPEGLDALKQRIGAITNRIPYEELNSNRIGNDIYSSIKNTISKQAPTYSKVMSDYSEASEQIREIEKALSLGAKSSADTALKKLQSITRNNVSTNYGQRLSLAKELEQEGGKPFISSLAGQALSSPTARGLAGGVEAMTLLSSFANPYSLLAIPFQTPKVVGMGLYKAGQAGAKIGGTATKLGINATRANTLNSILNAINRTTEE